MDNGSLPYGGVNMTADEVEVGMMVRAYGPEYEELV